MSAQDQVHQVTLLLTEAEAQDLLTCVAEREWRYERREGHRQAYRLRSLGERIGATFEREFGAHPGWYERIARIFRLKTWVVAIPEGRQAEFLELLRNNPPRPGKIKVHSEGGGKEAEGSLRSPGDRDPGPWSPWSTSGASFGVCRRCGQTADLRRFRRNSTVGAAWDCEWEYSCANCPMA